MNGKGAHYLLRTDLKPFFNFGNQYLNEGLVSRNAVEPIFFSFRLCAFSMDVSAEQKFLNTGWGVTQIIKPKHNTTIHHRMAYSHDIR